MGARKRWGPPRVVRLDSLNVHQRELVISLVTSLMLANETASDATETVA